MPGQNLICNNKHKWYLRKDDKLEISMNYIRVYRFYKYCKYFFHSHDPFLIMPEICRTLLTDKQGKADAQ